jgi:hypothetical protein
VSERQRLRVEVPRGAFVKRDEHGVAELWSPLPCPFAYGSVIGTQAEDGDALDAVLLGGAPPAGAEVEGRLVGRVPFVDDGVQDDKLVFWIGAGPGPGRRQRALVAAFFFAYALAKGARAALRGSRASTRAAPPRWQAGGPPLPVDR